MPSAGLPNCRVIVTALEAAVHDMAVPGAGADRLNGRRQRRIAARAGIGADVEGRKFAVEQARDHGADRMAVVKRHLLVRGAQALQFAIEGGVIGVEIAGAPFGDFGCVGAFAVLVERLAVEGRGRTELGRRLSGIERDAGRVAVDVDHGARDRRVNRGRAHVADEIVKPVDPPVGVLARQPGRDEARLEFGGNVGAGVREGDHKRLIAAVNGQPVRHWPLHTRFHNGLKPMR